MINLNFKLKQHSILLIFLNSIQLNTIINLYCYLIRKDHPSCKGPNVSLSHKSFSRTHSLNHPDGTTGSEKAPASHSRESSLSPSLSIHDLAGTTMEFDQSSVSVRLHDLRSCSDRLNGCWISIGALVRGFLTHFSFWFIRWCWFLGFNCDRWSN